MNRNFPEISLADSVPPQYPDSVRQVAYFAAVVYLMACVAATYFLR